MIVKPWWYLVEWRNEGKVRIAEFDMRKGRRRLHVVVRFDGVDGEITIMKRGKVVRQWYDRYVNSFFALQSAMAVAEGLLSEC